MNNMKAKQSVEENILSPTARTLIKQAKQEERATLKAQVRKEIEEKRDDWKGLEKMTTTDIAGEIYRALDDCLSIPSLKKS